MIQEIKGDHYYLTDEQHKTVFKQLESDSVPTYLVVGKDGKVLNKSEGLRSEVLEALERAQKSPSPLIDNQSHDTAEVHLTVHLRGVIRLIIKQITINSVHFSNPKFARKKICH